MLPLLLITATAGTAVAQPSIAEPRSDLSQINGHPIKVGEHNEYYYTFKRRNVSANPLGWMVGIYGVSGSYAVTDNVVLKGDVTYYHLVGEDDTGLELSATAPIYFRRAYQGAFIEPGLMIRRWNDNYECDTCSYDATYDYDDSHTTVGPQVLFGWHWTWDSGLNVAAAAGVGRDLADDREYDEPVFFNGYFRIGYAF